MSKKKTLKQKNKNLSASKRQRNLIKAGAMLSIGAGALMSSTFNASNPQAAPKTSDSLTDEKLNGNDNSLEKLENTSVDELLNALHKGESTEVSTQTGNVATLVDSLPSATQLAQQYPGATISGVQTSYDIRKLVDIKDADVYYTTSTLSSTDPQLLKMTEYRTLLADNPNVAVEATGNYKVVSAHLYSSQADARQDAANWKDSRVIRSTRDKEIGFDSKSKNTQLNFQADDGTFMLGVRIDRDLSLDVKADNGSAPLTENMKNDFIDAMEKNFTVSYNGKVYHAVYHDEAVRTDLGKDKIDGFFTFSDSTHGLPLQINNRFIVDAVHFGSTVDSLEKALSLHAVTSYENTNSWLNTNEPTTDIGLNYVQNLKDDGTTYYQIEAKEQVVHSLMYDYVSVAHADEKAEGDTVYAAEVSPSSTSATSASISVANPVAAVLASVNNTVNITADNMSQYFTTGGKGVATSNGVKSDGASISGGIATLTPNKQYQVGNITLNTKIDLTQDFAISGKVNLGDKAQSKSGADGIGFFFQPGDTTLTGHYGGGLGLEGLSNGFGFALDTYYNPFYDSDSPALGKIDASGNKVTSSTVHDPAKLNNGTITQQAHGANDWNRTDSNYAYGSFYNTNANGVLNIGPTPTSGTPGTGATKINNPSGNNFISFSMQYDAANHTLTVTYGGTNTINEDGSISVAGNYQQWSENVASMIPASQQVSFCVAGSTGGSYNLQQVQFDSFSYTQAQGTINVKYVDATTGLPFPNVNDPELNISGGTASLSGVVGDPYSTSALPEKDIPTGYKLISTTNNTSGKFTANDQADVVYTYAPDYQESAVHTVKETIHYKNTDGDMVADDFVSKTPISMFTVLNPVTNKSITYYKSGVADTPNIDQITGKPDSSWSTSLSFAEVSNPKVDGYHWVKTDAPNSDSTKVAAQTPTYDKGDLEFNVYYANDQSKLTVNWVTNDGKVLQEPVTTTENVGTAYQTQGLSQIPDGYKLLRVEGNETGTYQDGADTIVTYVYGINYTVTTHQVTQTVQYREQGSNNPLGVADNVQTFTVADVHNPVDNTDAYYFTSGTQEAPTIDENGKLTSDSWSSTNPSFVATDKVDVPTYHYVDTDAPNHDESAIASSTVDEKSTDTTYTVYYAHDTSTLKVNYVDTKGQQVAPSINNTGNVGDEYHTTSSTAVPPGYKLVRVEGVADGTYQEGTTPDVTYVYAVDYSSKIDRTVTQTIRYLDERNNNQVADNNEQTYTIATVHNPVLNTDTYYFASGIQTTPPSVDNDGNVSNGWSTTNPEYAAVANPAVKKMVVTKDSLGSKDLSQVAGSQVTPDTEDNTITVFYNVDPNAVGLVNVHYVDKSGQRIADDTQISGKIDEAYQTNPLPQDKVPDGYMLVGLIKGNDNGNFTIDDQDVTYQYMKVSVTSHVTTETINYVDTDNKPIESLTPSTQEVTFVDITTDTGQTITIAKLGAYDVKDTSNLPSLDELLTSAKDGTAAADGWQILNDGQGDGNPDVTFTAVPHPTVDGMHVIANDDNGNLQQVDSQTITSSSDNLNFHVMYSSGDVPPGNTVVGDYQESIKQITETIHYVNKETGGPIADKATSQITWLTVTNSLTGKQKFYFYNPKLENKGVPNLPTLADDGTVDDSSWTEASSTTFKEVVNPHIDNYKVISSNDILGGLTEISAQQVSSTSKDLDFTVVYAPETSTLTVNYVDTEGNKIAPSITSTGNVGDEYRTASSSAIPDGYVLLYTPGNANGTYIEGTTPDVTYVYQKVVPAAPPIAPAPPSTPGDNGHTPTPPSNVVVTPPTKEGDTPPSSKDKTTPPSSSDKTTPPKHDGKTSTHTSTNLVHKTDTGTPTKATPTNTSVPVKPTSSKEKSLPMLGGGSSLNIITGGYGLSGLAMIGLALKKRHDDNKK